MEDVVAVSCVSQVLQVFEHWSLVILAQQKFAFLSASHILLSFSLSAEGKRLGLGLITTGLGLITTGLTTTGLTTTGLGRPPL